MPGILTHFVVSYAIASRIVGYKRAVLLCLFGLLPDIDVFLGMHRWCTHSVAIATLIAIPLIGVIWLFKSRRLVRMAVVAYLLYIMHIVLDLFTAPTPLLWPVHQEAYMISIEVMGFIEPGAEIGIVPRIELYSESTRFVLQRVEGPIISTSDMLITIAIALLLLIDRIDVLNRDSHPYR